MVKNIGGEIYKPILNSEDVFVDHLLPLNILKSIEEDYNDRKLPRSLSLFTSDKWTIPGTVRDVNIYFGDVTLFNGKKLSDPEYFPIRLFFKVYIFHLMLTDRSHGDLLANENLRDFFNKSRLRIANMFIENDILCWSFDKECKVLKQARPPSLLSNSSIDMLIEQVPQTISTYDGVTGVLSSLAFFLGKNDDVPHYLKTAYNPFYFSYVKQLYPEGLPEDSSQGYPIIPDKDYYYIGSSAIEFIDCYANDIVKLNDLIIEVLRTEPPKELKAKNLNNSKSRKRLAASRWRLELIAKKITDLGIQLPKYTKQQCISWNVEQVSLCGAPHNYEDLKIVGFTWEYIFYLCKLLVSACTILILIPTGMRCSEFEQIDMSRVPDNPNSDGVYPYGNAIKKIRAKSTKFRINDIPIPYEAWNAMQILHNMTKLIKDPDSTMIFFNQANTFMKTEQIDGWGTLPAKFSSMAGGTMVNKRIFCFCNFIRSETIAFSHQFRKTLANFFLSKTKRAPILLMQLFGHKSIAMTMKYLDNNKLIKREVKLRIKEKFSKDVHIVALAIRNNSVSGLGADRLINAIDARINCNAFKGETEAEMMRDLEDWLIEKIESDNFLITHTPTNICCRPRASNDTPPCHCNTCDYIDPSLPNPSGCTGADCTWALKTFKQMEDRGENLIYFKHIIDKVDPELLADQKLHSFEEDFTDTWCEIEQRIKRLPVEEANRLIRTQMGSDK
jgi:hypothetical protein